MFFYKIFFFRFSLICRLAFWSFFDPLTMWFYFPLFWLLVYFWKTAENIRRFLLLFGVYYIKVRLRFLKSYIRQWLCRPVETFGAVYFLVALKFLEVFFVNFLWLSSFSKRFMSFFLKFIREPPNSEEFVYFHIFRYRTFLETLQTMVNEA